EEHREFKARIFGVKAGHQLLFGFGKIKWRAVGLRDGGDEETEEANNLRKNVPPENPFGTGLRGDDLPQAEAARQKEDTDDRHGERKFIADHLRGAAQAAEERVLVIRGPAGKGDAVDAERGNRKKGENADVQIGDTEINVAAKNVQRTWAKGNDGDGSEREGEGHQRSQKIGELVHTGRGGIFLQEKFRAIGGRLEQAVRSHAMRTPARLDVRDDLAFEPGEIGVCSEHGDKQDRYFYKRDEDLSVLG